MIKDYYLLTKPGIIKGNLLTGTTGFLLAARGIVNISLLTETLVGISLVIAASCVFNNYIDRDIDKKMLRTKDRALASGKISGANALLFGSVLGALGFIELYLFTNLIVVGLGALATFFYVVVYGYFKRKSIYGTLVGTISGSIPPVAGYAAASGEINTVAILLFIIVVFWQMAHFYAIALYRIKDYKAAEIPVYPAVKGVTKTKRQIIYYMIGFSISAVLLGFESYSSRIYAVIYGIIGVSWLVFGLSKYSKSNSEKWGKRVFLCSLIVICLFSVAVSVSSFLS